MTNDRLDALAARARHELAAMAYPNVDWVRPLGHDSGQVVYDVVIVGGGQSGLCAAFNLRCDGVSRILVLDKNPEGYEGPWETFARMDRLRTPRFIVGMERGQPSLSTRAWFEARHGEEAWAALDRVPRKDWMEYLRWYRRVLDLPVRNDATVESIEPDGAVFALRVATPKGRETVLARRVVLATGYEAAGAWVIPAFLRDALPPELCWHSNVAADFSRLRGQRVGVLGHGASAFDSALAALRQGAASVDICFRRQDLPRANPHRWVEFAGFLKHYPELDDATRWSVNHHFDAVDQPPARHGFEAAHAFDNFRVHPGAGWTAARVEGGAVAVETPRGSFVFDTVIAATGSQVDLRSRPELGAFVGDIALWRDRYTPPEDESHPMLGRYPYLGAHYEFQAREPGAAPFLERIHAFNFSSIISCGPHSTSISGHKYAIPRLVGGITSSFFREQAGWLVPALKAYDEVELELPLRDGAPAAGLFTARQAIG